MNRLKDLWGGQDAINRVAFIAAIAAFAWCIVQGHGLYGVVFAVVILFLIISRQNQREKRFSRLYGTMYFPMPDGELVPRSFEQVKNEYVHGAQSNYADRKVELRFPWWYLNSAGEIDTGFGLTVRIGDKQELADEARLMRRGDIVRVVGTLVAENRQYFYIGKLEEMEAAGLNTDEQHRQYHNTLALLCQVVPELADYIDLETDTINGGTEALRANTEAWKQKEVR